ncbi:MAG: glyoxylate/hydroxypyruvate reductase A [Sneathiella sp.]|nr:glyoxylate/hydroxypyruvate reductase A [Sneathiella sp.]
MSEVIPFVSQLELKEEQEWIEVLSRQLPKERIVGFSALTAADKKDAKIAIVANPNPDEISQLPNLVWIHSVWAGVERLVGELGDQPFGIVRLIDPELARTMAEAVLAWSLYLHRDMPAYARQQKNRQWKEIPYRSVSNRTVGILGLGELGTAAAQLLAGIGFKVIGWSRSQKQVDNVITKSGEDGLAETVSRSDILVSLLPLTDQTRGLIDKSVFDNLPDQAGLINFGRGPVVAIEDLVRALDQGRLSHAVLDVFEQEPLPTESALWDHDAITVLPHISAPTNMKTASEIVARNIVLYRQKGILPVTVSRKLGY